MSGNRTSSCQLDLEDQRLIDRGWYGQQAALTQYADEMNITKAMPWGEHLTLTTRETLEDVDPNDDLKREVAL